MQNFFLYGPTLDSKSSNPFMPIPLPEMAKNGIDVPLIIGFVSHEGMRFLKGRIYKVNKLRTKKNLIDCIFLYT